MKIRLGKYNNSEIFSGMNYQRIIPNMGELDISLALNTDGVDIFEISNKAFWLVFLTINEITYPERFLLKSRKCPFFA